MKVEARIEQPADLERVFEMYLDAGFQQAKCRASMPVSFDVAITSGTTGPVVVCTRVMPSDGLPDFVRGLVRDGITVVERVVWDAAALEGRRRAQVRVSFTGQPLGMTGVLELVPSDVGTRVSLVGELRAGIPVIGGRIEKAAAPVILKAMTVEETVGREWLADERHE